MDKANPLPSFSFSCTSRLRRFMILSVSGLLLRTPSSLAFQSFSFSSRRSFLAMASSDAPSIYWNREESTRNAFSSSNKPVTKPARIISLSDPNDDANDPFHKAASLPEGATLLKIGGFIKELDLEFLKSQEPNVIFVSHPKAREPLAELLTALPSIEWIHTRSAGIDFCTSPTLANAPVTVTNAKGQFSSSKCLCVRILKSCMHI